MPPPAPAPAAATTHPAASAPPARAAAAQARTLVFRFMAQPSPVERAGTAALPDVRRIYLARRPLGYRASGRGPCYLDHGTDGRAGRSCGMGQTVGWARIWYAVKHDDDVTLRQGAWYPVLNTAPTRGDLDVSGRRVTVPQDVIELRPRRPRSEEHTSELQSPCNLVCRLLLEKKKTTTTRQSNGTWTTALTCRP